MVGKGGRVFRNNYELHVDKTKVGWDQVREVGIAGVRGSVGGKMQTTVLNNNKKLLAAIIIIIITNFDIVLGFY